MVNEIKYRKELEHLRMEHKALEGNLNSEISSKVVNQFSLQKLKKQKLELKDKISQLESMLVGDIVA
jgi:hypothetical protein